MYIRFSIFLSLSAMLLSAVEGQFGIAGKRRNQAGTSFQELNEQAKKMADVGGTGNIDELMKNINMGDMGGDGMMKYLENLGPQFDEMMKMMADMPPEELTKSIQDAMSMLKGDELVSSMLGNSDEVLNMLENSGMVDQEEVEKFKKDPEYFEHKMKESMDQMQQLFSDPKMIENVKEGVEAAQNLYKNPGAVNEMMESMFKDLSDEDIESMRQIFLGNDDEVNPMMQQLVGSMNINDLEDVLKDPIKWRKTVKEGLGLRNQQENLGMGAGVGEL